MSVLAPRRVHLPAEVTFPERVACIGVSYFLSMLIYFFTEHFSCWGGCVFFSIGSVAADHFLSGRL